jgi:hypothetical protein
MLAFRFAVWLGAMIVGAVYTIVQTGGPDPAEMAFCKLVQKVFPATTEHCVPGFSTWGLPTIAIIGLIFGALIAIDLFRLVLTRRRKKKQPEAQPPSIQLPPAPVSAPRLKCSFSMSDAGCVHHNIPFHETLMQPGQTPYARIINCDWYRIRVDAIGGNVPNCRGRLLSVKRGGNELLAGEHPPLHFTHSGDSAGTTIVAEGVSEFLDLLAVLYDQRVTLAVPFNHRSSSIQWSDMFSLAGEYEIKVMITAPSVTAAPVELVLRWNLNPATAEIAQRTPNTSTTETESQVLKLSVGTDAEYYDVPKNGLYSFTKRFKVKLENANTYKAITNGKVQILSIDPFCGYRGPWLIEEGITLAAGDHKFLPLAQYNQLREPEKGMTPEDTFVINSVETREHHKPLLGTETRHVLVIRATAFDVPFNDIKCQLWVDNGRFQIEKI